MKDTGSNQQEEECERVEEEGQGIKRMSFRSEIKKQYEKLESVVLRKKNQAPKNPQRWERKREVGDTLLEH